MVGITTLGRENCYLFWETFNLFFLLHVPILLLQHLPPMQPGSCQMSLLHASEIPCWLVRPHCGRGGSACDMVRAGHEGWGVGRGYQKDVTASWHLSWISSGNLWEFRTSTALARCVRTALLVPHCPAWTKGRLWLLGAFQNREDSTLG